MTAPVLLVGLTQIGEVLGVGNREVQHMHNQRRIPTFNIGGTPAATESGLRDWMELRAGLTPPSA